MSYRLQNSQSNRRLWPPKGTIMNLQAIQMQNGPKSAWTRTGALVLFLVTGILLVATLTTARSQQMNGLSSEHGISRLNYVPAG
jgi:hypothetical protein